jgi:hypothetical protein
MNGFRSAGPARKQEVTGAGDELVQIPISGGEMTDEHALMILGPGVRARW